MIRFATFDNLFFMWEHPFENTRASYVTYKYKAMITDIKCPCAQDFVVTDSSGEVSSDEDVRALAPDATLFASFKGSDNRIAPMRVCEMLSCSPPIYCGIVRHL